MINIHTAYLGYLYRPYASTFLIGGTKFSFNFDNEAIKQVASLFWTSGFTQYYPAHIPGSEFYDVTDPLGIEYSVT